MAADALLMPALRPSAPLAIPRSLFKAWYDEASDDGSMQMAARSRAGGDGRGARPQLDVRGGVAVLQLIGPLFHYANGYTAAGYGVSCQELSAQLAEALDDPKVRAILLEVDSPGGEVAGCSALAQAVYAARERKRIGAHATALCAGGAYWVASAAAEVTASETALLCGLGIIATYYVPSPDADVREISIVSSQSPKKRPDPATDKGRAQLQQVIDDLGAVMLQGVARNRGTSVETVAKRYGEGDVLIGRKAVAAGAAERLTMFDQALADLSPAVASARASTAQRSARGVAPAPARATAPVPAVPAAAIAVAATPAPLPPPALAPALDPVAERRRREAIRALALPGMEAVIAAALADPRCTPADAAGRLLRAQMRSS